MRRTEQTFLALGLASLLAACATPTPSPGTQPSAGRPAPARPVRPSTVPPSNPQPVTPGAFIAPQVMNDPDLAFVIGSRASQLEQTFGRPRLDVLEGDARKLQFVGEACVLDVFLYPLSPGAEPSATYVEARRASDALDVDRAACANALKR